MHHPERHQTHRMGWLRAAVLGANDGLISTASLIIGVAIAGTSQTHVIIIGVAALFAGAMSMAAGEYVSVSSQSDTEQADLARERWELENQPEAELLELTHIYQKRGVSADLAKQVAEQMTAHDALAAHARDELGINEITAARPLQAAVASAASFAVGAVLPILITLLVAPSMLIVGIAISTVFFLAALGCFGAHIGRAPMLRAAVRVTFWGMLAMGITAAVGSLFGVSA